MSQTTKLKRATPTSSDITMSLMTEIVSYPVLLQHEEALTKKGSNMYDVSSWMLYLNECDALLSQTVEYLTSSIKQTRNDMNKYPRIWLMYLHYTILNSPPSDTDITHIRRLIIRALLALPAT